MCEAAAVAAWLSVALAVLLAAERVTRGFVTGDFPGEAVPPLAAFFGVFTASICVWRTNMPWFSGHLKYVMPCTVPLFLPGAGGRGAGGRGGRGPGGGILSLRLRR